MDVSVVITCWNGKQLLEKNLPSVLEAANNPENRIKEIIVVDDGSTDDSVEYLRKLTANSEQLPENKKPTTGNRSPITIKLLENGKNYGYAYTCNQGVKEAKADLVAILNLDVVPEEDFLVSCLPHFADNKVFSVSFNEGSYGPGKLAWKNGFIEIVALESEKDTAQTSWPSGGSSLFRKSFWQEIGGMDEIFLPFYFEDIDLGIRAYKSGYLCLWEPKSRVDHKHESTINKDNFDMAHVSLIKQRNHLLLTWKNIDSFKLFLSHFWGILRRAITGPGYIKVIIKAVSKIGGIEKKKYPFTTKQVVSEEKKE